MDETMAFRMLMERADHALQNRGLLQDRRGAAMVDWEGFGLQLGEPFFEKINASGVAPTLISEPPRRRLNQDGQAQWEEEMQVAPLGSVTDLIVRGVCQVRHNLVHGNKAALTERDRVLIGEAYRVMEMAAQESELWA